MQAIISKVKEYIQSEGLLHEGSKVIIGVSGGADSIALLDILIDLGYDCIAAHCNFHLRGEESDRDFNFVKQFCENKHMKFIHIDFDTYKYMDEKKISLEMAARELRYNWFEKIRTEFNADKIAVAHHQDDSIETVLINLIRGTGIKGLTGIPAVNGNIIRPLLSIYRQDVLDYLSSKKLNFVEDSTNQEDIYVRNKIRLNIIPLLETINPSAKQSISKTADNLASVEKIYNKKIQDIKAEIFSDNKINIDLLLKQDEPKTILFEVLHPYGFNSDSISNIFNALHNQSGKQFYSEKYVLIKDRTDLILDEIKETDQKAYTISEDVKHINTPIGLSIEYLNSIDEFKNVEKNSNIIYIDAEKLNFPLSIRRWEQGDRFTPFGMKGSKKISDYFSDQKLSIIEKGKIWLLCSSDNKIVWIIGKRADDRFKVTVNTTRIIKISLIPD